ncbi:MAG: dTMP kinase [Acidobacteriota bacterium]
MPRGRLITLEGVEGSGKTTQIELLAAELTARGLPVVTTREPGGTRLGERLREILLDPTSDPVPLAELMILEAARTQLVATVIEPALRDGRWVLSDRFSDSSLAYQGLARGLGEPAVTALNALACGSTVPACTVVLDLPVEEALARARTRPSTTSSNRRFEDERLAFHQAVAEAFRELAAREPGRVVLVDGSGTPAEVHARVVHTLAGILP